VINCKKITAKKKKTVQKTKPKSKSSVENQTIEISSGVKIKNNKN
jgi:hypothetical protein